MIFLSKVIKNCSVCYNELPRTIDGNSNIKVQTTGDIRSILSQNALESADISLKSSLKKVLEIAQWERVESQIVFSDAKNSGMEHGFADGLKIGCDKAEAEAHAKVQKALESFADHTDKLDSAYMARLQGARDECIDFAFSIAENILNIKIDREDSEYKADIENFMSLQSCRVTIESDGCQYVMNTLRADELISCAHGIENIAARIEPQQEEEEQTDLDDETANDDTSLGLQQELQEEKAAQTNLSNETENNNTSPGLQQPQEEKTAQTNLSNETENNDTSLGLQQPQEEKIVQTDIGQEDETQLPAGERPEDFEDNEEFNSDKSEGDMSDEKFVFVRPARRVAILPSGIDGNGSKIYNFEDILLLGSDSLKVITRKAGIKDLTAALQGAPEEAVSSILEACPRRIKEKVLDGIKYLGPVPENEVQEARTRLAHLADELSLH
jgi:hypothetical protein